MARQRQRVPQGPPPAPAVQKLRIRYAKRGRMRFSSTRDFQRALERALRRAGVPMAFSAGFHPHPKISYANAAPTGAASEAEYAEISVIEQLEPEAVRAALDAALPRGLDVLAVVPAAPGSLADRLQASTWSLRFEGVEPERLAAAVETFLAAEQIEVTRVLKNGPRTFDVRSAVVRAEVGSDDEVGDGPGGGASARASDGAGEGTPSAAAEEAESGAGEGHVDIDAGSGQLKCAILHLVVRHTTPAVRPDDVVTALRTHAAFEPPRSPLVTRWAQGPLLPHAAQVADPFDDSTAAAPQPR